MKVVSNERKKKKGSRERKVFQMKERKKRIGL